MPGHLKTTLRGKTLVESEKHLQGVKDTPSVDENEQRTIKTELEVGHLESDSTSSLHKMDTLDQIDGGCDDIKDRDDFNVVIPDTCPESSDQHQEVLVIPDSCPSSDFTPPKSLKARSTSEPPRLQSQKESDSAEEALRHPNHNGALDKHVQLDKHDSTLSSDTKEECPRKIPDSIHLLTADSLTESSDKECKFPSTTDNHGNTDSSESIMERTEQILENENEETGSTLARTFGENHIQMTKTKTEAGNSRTTSIPLEDAASGSPDICREKCLGNSSSTGLLGLRWTYQTKSRNYDQTGPQRSRCVRHKSRNSRLVGWHE